MGRRRLPKLPITRGLRGGLVFEPGRHSRAGGRADFAGRPRALVPGSRLPVRRLGGTSGEPEGPTRARRNGLRRPRRTTSPPKRSPGSREPPPSETPSFGRRSVIDRSLPRHSHRPRAGHALPTSRRSRVQAQVRRAAVFPQAQKQDSREFLVHKLSYISQDAEIPSTELSSDFVARNSVLRDSYVSPTGYSCRCGAGLNLWRIMLHCGRVDYSAPWV